MRHIDNKKTCKLNNIDVNPENYKTIILREYNTNDIILQQISKDKPLNKPRKLEKIDNSIHHSTIDNSVHVVNNITININSVEYPNTEYLTSSDSNGCLKNIETSMLEMAKKIYFNPKHPENHSIYKTTMKNKIIKYFKDNKWNVGDQDVIINTMVNNIKDALEENHTGEQHYELYDKYENDEKFKNKVDRSLLIECYNNKPTR